MTDTPSREELPLPDWNDIPLATLAERIRPLDEAGLGALLAYEEAHGHRLPVTTILHSRLEQLRGGAEPTGSVPESLPEVSRSSSGSPVSPATSGPPINPPSHGVPTNPAQPR
ncbi:hypothetical protein C5C41_11905 [Rathayibacter sp. AY1E9]|uniref:hypothetical protein n=1 Tax=unclassified Rathayibacter TaxID=2609250 RepID=UPI000CE8CDC9|nr:MULTISPECIES: hypothetical protein [unclassified Rathayibacter]PPG41874.1 hypothetical protein C5C30_07320 [Rathayibacter sp. AY2B5]PPG51284.1 hypothetical protein C5C41_11905 [Rathayibacter sp. AY1E9]